MPRTSTIWEIVLKLSEEPVAKRQIAIGTPKKGGRNRMDERIEGNEWRENNVQRMGERNVAGTAKGDGTGSTCRKGQMAGLVNMRLRADGSG